MELHNLKPAKGSVKKNTRRKGRGQGSGRGGTSTRGHKGQASRSGFSQRFGFEGGQMPLQRRLPKRGFKNPHRVEYVAINLKRLQEIADKYDLDVIDVNTLLVNGVIKRTDRVKILGNGELTTKLSVTAHAFSKVAKESIEKVGGTVNLV